MKRITLNEEVTRMQEMMGITHTSRNGKNAIEELSPSDIVNSMREEETDENTEVLNKFKDQYGKEKGEKIYYATANKQERDPETFEKNEESAIGSWDLAMEEGEQEESFMQMRAGKDGKVYENEEMGGNDEVEESTITYYITKNTDKYGDTTYIVMKKYPYKDGYMVDEYNGEQYADTYQAQQVLNYLIRRQEKSSTRMTTGKEGEVYENEEMGEARKLQQETYFETQTGALQSAEEYATHKGYTVNWESINPEHVAYGQTVKYSVELMKDGIPARKMLQISLYRMESGKYELTNYIN
jgi:hypothetical protein